MIWTWMTKAILCLLRSFHYHRKEPPMKTVKPFAGVLAPVLTSFRQDLVPDPERFVTHCRWLLEQGITGLAVFGTISEANSLCAEERIDLLDALIAGGIRSELL